MKSIDSLMNSLSNVVEENSYIFLEIRILCLEKDYSAFDIVTFRDNNVISVYKDCCKPEDMPEILHIIGVHNQLAKEQSMANESIKYSN